ncbi:MAG: hypothetical protein A2030_04965 [Chloroflexi bacterium RBG_19FT_COMBO_50_10]|nr:MAG: hypothetical protein A2030_04965 [Chloroflexi bacterium RBG_19FT_COMBO_50_10]
MSLRKDLIVRMSFFVVLGVVLAAIISEVAFRLQGDTTSRDPQTIQLVIPPGTFEKVAQGQNVLPAGQVFVVGDVLQVKNEDSVTQTLGPLVIPPGSSASMKLDQAGSLSYTCSFQPSQSYGIEVQQALTFGMRLQASLLAGLPLGVLLGVYSLVVKPLKPKTQLPQA